MENLYQAVWYRSKVKLKGTQIIPEPPFEAYNPFDFYYSSKQGRRGRKSLYLEFLDIDTENPDAILNFCERFGVLGVRNLNVLDPMARLVFNFAESLELPLEAPGNIRLDQFNPVSQLWDQVKDHVNKLDSENPEKGKEARELFAQMHRDSTRPDPAEIFVPMEITDFTLAQFELKKATITLPAHEHLPEHTQRDHKMGYINHLLSDTSVRPYLQWDIQRGQPVLGWEAHRLSEILCLMAMLDFLGPGNILVCSWCQKFILADSPRIRFCSPQCGNSFKVREHKLRKASQGQKSLPKKSVSGVQTMANKKRGTHGTKRRER